MYNKIIKQNFNKVFYKNKNTYTMKTDIIFNFKRYNKTYYIDIYNYDYNKFDKISAEQYIKDIIYNVINDYKDIYTEFETTLINYMKNYNNDFKKLLSYKMKYDKLAELNVLVLKWVDTDNKTILETITINNIMSEFDNLWDYLTDTTLTLESGVL